MKLGYDVSVVIPTRNRYKTLQYCLASIQASTRVPDELIIVDDQSSDATASLSDWTMGRTAVRVFHAARRLMMSEARTVGARAARGDLILFVDDDNVLDSRMIEYLVKTANAYPKLGILGPVMYTASTRQIQTAFQRISLLTGHTWGPQTVPAEELVASNGIPNVFMVRRVVFEQCGYFDAALLATYSEPDLAWRARLAGWQCAVVTAAKTFHDNLPAGTLIPRTMGGGTFPQKSYCMIRNRMVMVRRYGRWWEQLGFFLFFHWWWPMVYSLVMVRYARFDLIAWYWRGWRDGWRYGLTGTLVNSFSSSAA